MKKELEIIKVLQNKGYEAYFVGGAVRAKLLGLKPNDYDIVTNAKPKEIQEIFKDRKLSHVGEQFKVMLIDGIEVATFRGERYDVVGKPVCTYVDTLKEDCSRRDFTINAIAYDPIKDEYYDYYGGMNDIKYKLLRFVGNPSDRIKEDPVRILRGFRFASILNFDIEDRTFTELTKKRDSKKRIKAIPKERIQKEIMKSISNLKQFCIYLKEAGILGSIFPSLKNVYYLDGGPHHKETVFEHCIDTCSYISSKYPELKIAGLLHDVGKAKYELKNGKLTFPLHERYSCTSAERDLRNLKFSNDFIDKVSNLIKYHMWVIVPKSTDKAIRKWLISLRKDEVEYKDMLRLKMADMKANRKKEKKPLSYWKIILRKIRKVENEVPAFCVKDLHINGNDIMRKLGLKRGSKIIGDILQEIFKMVVDNQIENSEDKLMDYLNRKF